MKLRTIIKLMSGGRPSLMLRLSRTSNEFYRACFVAAALSRGIYDAFGDGKISIDDLCKEMKVSNREGLLAWLELGVSLGELKRSGNEFHIKGRLSKALLKSDNDTYGAFLEEIVGYHYRYVMDTPSVLKEQKRFPFDETPGELVARSSRMSEPFILEIVDTAVPRHGDFWLLEIGCGSGVYIQRACARNQALQAVGLELQERVADAARNNVMKWGLEDRVTIVHSDVREYSSLQKFDLITLHQNIYYFSVSEREDLFRCLAAFLKPGGQVLLTTICRNRQPTIRAMDIWVSTTDGYGSLPNPDQLVRQFRDAGFSEVTTKRLMPFVSLWGFIAAKDQ